jgi:cell wall-associated NlpC family hydrolase
MGLLRVGSEGPEVRRVQEKLNEIYEEQLEVDGLFGEHTEEMVMAFQDDEGLETDGLVGALTWVKLFPTQANRPPEPPPPAGVVTGQMVVDKAMVMDGKPYVFGYEIVLTNPNPKSADCSELVEWDTYQLLGKSYKLPDGAENQYHYCKLYGTLIPIAQAIKTPGALLFRITSGGDHVAISRGDGTTIEARSTADGCGVFTAKGRPWTHAAKIPGVRY